MRAALEQLKISSTSWFSLGKNNGTVREKAGGTDGDFSVRWTFQGKAV